MLLHVDMFLWKHVFKRQTQMPPRWFEEKTQQISTIHAARRSQRWARPFEDNMGMWQLAQETNRTCSSVTIIAFASLLATITLKQRNQILMNTSMHTTHGVGSCDHNFRNIAVANALHCAVQLLLAPVRLASMLRIRSATCSAIVIRC